MILIFDLDDTLYSRGDYVNNGLRNVVNFIKSKNKNLDKKKIFKELKKNYYNKKLKKTFNHFLKKNNFKSVNLKNCISLFRYGKKKIKPHKETLKLLKKYKKNCYLVTDGNKNVQKFKIKELGIQKYFKRIFITNQFGLKNQKPSLFCFNKIKEIEKCKYSDMVYIGDNPIKDFVNCNKVGIKTIRIMKGEFKNYINRFPCDAKYKIKQLKDLNKILRLFR